MFEKHRANAQDFSVIPRPRLSSIVCALELKIFDDPQKNNHHVHACSVFANLESGLTTRST